MLLSCYSNDTQKYWRKFRKLVTTQDKNITWGKPMFQAKMRQQQQGPSKHSTLKHSEHLQSTERMSSRQGNADQICSPRSGMHNLFAVAGHIMFIFMNDGLCEFKSFYFFSIAPVLLSHAEHSLLSRACFDQVSSYAEDKEFIIMHGHYSIHIKLRVHDRIHLYRCRKLCTPDQDQGFFWPVFEK